MGKNTGKDQLDQQSIEPEEERDTKAFLTCCNVINQVIKGKKTGC